MEFFKAVIKLFFKIVKIIIIIITIVVLTIGFVVINCFIQERLFIENEFILWTTHYSSMIVMLLFEGIIISIVYYVKDRKKPDFPFTQLGKLVYFMKKNKAKVIPVLSISFVIIIYYALFNVSVLYRDKLVSYTFTVPKGKNYSYSDIQSINTGFHRKRIPFIQSKGQFYYSIQMNDGRKINLNGNPGGTINDKDIYLTILELDEKFVDAGIPKTVDKEYFYMEAQHLDKVYSNRIKSIVDNVK